MLVVVSPAVGYAYDNKVFMAEMLGAFSLILALFGSVWQNKNKCRISCGRVLLGTGWFWPAHPDYKPAVALALSSTSVYILLPFLEQSSVFRFISSLPKKINMRNTKTAGGVVLNTDGEVLVVSQQEHGLCPKAMRKGEDAMRRAGNEEESGKQFEYIKDLGTTECKFKDGGDDQSELKLLPYLFRTNQLE